jgi:hypothetical protein
MRSAATSSSSSPQKFFLTFPAHPPAFLYYSQEQADLAPEYDECPRVCGIGFKDSSDCTECPVRIAREEFEATLTETLDEQAKDWKRTAH